MRTDPFTILYMCQDGEQPSGVATYGYAVLTQFPHARMLLLNANRPPLAAPEAVLDCIITLPPEVSHDVAAVALAVAAQVDVSPDKVLLLPNTGDTTWAATLKWIRDAEPTIRSRVRVLGMVHSDIETQYILAKNYAAIAPVWIGVSRRCAQRLRYLTDPSTTRVYELPYPMDENLTFRTPRADRPLRLIYAGRLEEAQKRVSRLVALFQELNRQGLKYHATVAGDGPARNAFEKRIADSDPNVSASVNVLGALRHRDLEELWADQDIFILTSVYEGLPLALLESMSACVCPVVMSVRSGLPELLEDGINGRVVKQGDIGAMADAIVELDSHRELLDRLGNAAKETVSVGNLSPAGHFATFRAIVDESLQLPPPEIPYGHTDPIARAVDKICNKISDTNLHAVIYGAGMFGRKLVDACLSRNINVRALFDSDCSLTGFVYRHLTCQNPDHLIAYADCTFAIGSLQFTADIHSRIESEFREKGLTIPSIVRYSDTLN